MDHMTPSKDERTWAMVAHLVVFSSFIIPFGNIIGPLVVWLSKREQSAFVDHHGKEALNFAISTMMYAFVSFLLTIVVIGIFALIALGLFWMTVTIMAALKANDGEVYRYPLTIRFIK
ncbi:DUF4870 domain-containing protein [Brevibacillus dissolubilis]|uniref:DUF4870 domain-containing protein n=1 Tax=Brevibacillus dissolubilis TaxID=1844116 RepID=UPI0011175476|nr:DUF4870 domain-containing protein [Brevibacillus dissolubilis]